MKYVYDELSKIDFFRGKLRLSDLQDALNIVFHEYLCLFACDDFVAINKGLIHWHGNDDEIIQSVAELASGDRVFIEHRGFFTRPRGKYALRIYDNALNILHKEKFERRKEKYFHKKHLRIYTGNSIIKRSAK